MQYNYIDQAGTLQGPYTQLEITQWYNMGLLPHSLLISSSEAQFLPIAAARPHWAHKLPALPIFNPNTHIVLLDQDTNYVTISTYALVAHTLRGDFSPKHNLVYTDQAFQTIQLALQHKYILDTQQLYTQYITMWNYKTDRIHGPFNVQQMIEFIDTGEFTENTLIAKHKQDLQDSDFFEIGDLETAAERLFDEEEEERNALKCFYLNEDAKVEGPFSFDVFSKWIKNGELEEDVLACMFGDQFFSPIESHPVLGLIKAASSESENSIPQSNMHWYYIDDEGVTQGPFKSSLINEWIEAGYFNKDRKVSNQSANGPFVKLEEVMHTLLADLSRESFSTEHADFSDSESPKIWKYLDCELKEHGPFSEEQMKKFATSGVLSKDFFKFKRLDAGSDAHKDSNIQMLKNWMPLAVSLKSLYPFYGLLQDKWEYIDGESNKQGPFSTGMMRNWFLHGYFTSDLLVKTPKERDFVSIKDRDRPSFLSVPPVREAHAAGGDEEEEDYEEYAFSGTFNSRTGKFESSLSSGTRWERQGLPNDSAGRQLAQYFDVSGYHEDRNAKEKRRKLK